MRIETCANVAAGANERASKSANAVFFIMSRVLQTFNQFGIASGFRIVEGIDGVRLD